MKTAIFFLQNAKQTPILRRIIRQAMVQGYDRFVAALPISKKVTEWALVFEIYASELDQFPDNIFAADTITIRYEPAVWLCQQATEAFGVWDGSQDFVLKYIGVFRAWPLPIHYIDPLGARVPRTLL